MTPETFCDVALGPALRLLPPTMDTPEARAMIVAICLQESELTHRRQVNGPARGYPQFERAGVRGVLTHRASRDHAVRLCAELDVPATSIAVHRALEFHDVLAVVFARLLLFTLPARLPHRDHERVGWNQYLDAWRPGKPRQNDWPANFSLAWQIVGGTP